MRKAISCKFNIEQPVSRLNISCFYTPPEMRECNPITAASHIRKRCRQAGGTLCGYLLAFPCLSFRLSRFTLSQPLPELLLAFFTFVVG